MSDRDRGLSRSYRTIPGTIVFDSVQHRRGANLNRFLASLNHADNRERFYDDERTYLANFDLSPPALQAVLDRNWSHLVELGGQIFYVGKLAHADGLTTLQVCAAQAGLDESEYAAMMRAGGRPPEWSDHTTNGD